MPIYLIILSASILLLIIYLILYWRSYVAVKSHESSVESQESLPGISVVIITHDSDRMLQHTINTVAAQQYPDFEIVVVNNASTDDTNDVTQTTYKTSAPYGRIGIDFNILKNKHDIYRLYAGVRYAYTSFKFDVDHAPLIDPVWGRMAVNTVLLGVYGLACWKLLQSPWNRSVLKGATN